MCLFPKLLPNPKYKSTKKNGGNIPTLKDDRVKYVPVGCGKCMECMKAKTRQWQVRLQEEIRTDKTAQFVTLTFSNESIYELGRDIEYEGYERDNAIATKGVRLFLERWRAKHKKSVKHWLITELGHNGTENIHLHGLIFSPMKEEIKERWGYGFVYIGQYVNEKTINYCTKYATKMDLQHKYYQPKILTSPGIGSNYVNRWDAQQNKFNGELTRETYTTRQGKKINLPIYWRNKIYSEEEREELWLHKLDKKIRYVDKIPVDISTEEGLQNYKKILELAQEKNEMLGYGNDRTNFSQKNYEIKLRNLNFTKRITNQKKPCFADPETGEIFTRQNKSKTLIEINK